MQASRDSLGSANANTSSAKAKQIDQTTKPGNCPSPKPKQPPLQATEKNRKYLQGWLHSYYKSSTFNKCQHQPLPLMTSPNMRFMANPDAEPVAHHTLILVPQPWQEKVKACLGHEVTLSVLEPERLGEPMKWCHRMVVCAKTNTKPHHTFSPTTQEDSLNLDCWNDYHSVPLHENDSYLTSLITPLGCYHYKMAPQGYNASGDG